jgi:hypothetical protein
MYHNLLGVPWICFLLLLDLYSTLSHLSRSWSIPCIHCCPPTFASHSSQHRCYLLQKAISDLLGAPKFSSIAGHAQSYEFLVMLIWIIFYMLKHNLTLYYEHFASHLHVFLYCCLMTSLYTIEQLHYGLFTYHWTWGLFQKFWWLQIMLRWIYKCMCISCVVCECALICFFFFIADIKLYIVKNFIMTSPYMYVM